MAAHQKMLADSSLQFQWMTIPEIKPPAWLVWLNKWVIDPVARAVGTMFHWLDLHFGPYGAWIFWELVVALGMLILYFILRHFGWLHFWQRKRVAEENDPEGWQFDPAPLHRYLAEADALAGTGDYEAAAHLLLLRSFEDIAARRSNQLRPAHTAREMAQAPIIPERARPMFALIAAQVELSLFGDARLDAVGWERCRDAYRKFAMPGSWI